MYSMSSKNLGSSLGLLPSKEGAPLVPRRGGFADILDDAREVVLVLIGGGACRCLLGVTDGGGNGNRALGGGLAEYDGESKSSDGGKLYSVRGGVVGAVSGN